MTNTIAIAVATATIALSSATALAFTIGQKKIIKGEERLFARTIKATNKKCETSIKGSIDWKSFESQVNKKVNGKLNESIAGHCQTALDSLWTMCRDDEEYKATIASNITSYECKYLGNGKRRMSLKKGHLILWMSWNTKNLADYTTKWIGRAL